jgi:hypothetical protein
MHSRVERGTVGVGVTVVVVIGRRRGGPGEGHAPGDRHSEDYERDARLSQLRDPAQTESIHLCLQTDVVSG